MQRIVSQPLNESPRRRNSLGFIYQLRQSP
jgi:hypothetical protein